MQPPESTLSLWTWTGSINNIFNTILLWNTLGIINVMQYCILQKYLKPLKVIKYVWIIKDTYTVCFIFIANQYALKLKFQTQNTLYFRKSLIEMEKWKILEATETWELNTSENSIIPCNLDLECKKMYVIFYNFFFYSCDVKYLYFTAA